MIKKADIVSPILASDPSRTVLLRWHMRVSVFWSSQWEDGNMPGFSTEGAEFRGFAFG